MAKTLRILCMISLVMCADFTGAEETRSDDQLIQTLMTKSGLNKQLEQMPRIITVGMAKANRESRALSPEMLEEVNGKAAGAFDPTVLKTAVQKDIQANLPEEDTRAALAWLNTPLAEKIMKMEEKASTPEAYTEMLKMADQLTGNKARVDLVRKLDNAVKATETVVAIAMNTQTALIIGLTSTMKPEERPSLRDIENTVKKNRGEIRSAAELQTVVSFLYSYRELSDAEIGQYLKFAESAAGKKYHAAVANALNTALAGAARLLGSQIQNDEGKNIKNIKIDKNNFLPSV